jgi:hypothetical protein
MCGKLCGVAETTPAPGRRAACMPRYVHKYCNTVYNSEKAFRRLCYSCTSTPSLLTRDCASVCGAFCVGVFYSLKFSIAF